MLGTFEKIESQRGEEFFSSLFCWEKICQDTGEYSIITAGSFRNLLSVNFVKKIENISDDGIAKFGAVKRMKRLEDLLCQWTG